MNKKEFCQEAIKNGYDDIEMNGWEWIRANLFKLDNIFQSDKYKECDGMKYKCMPFLFGGMDKNCFTDLEQRVLETAWYLNNQRVQEKEKNDKIAELNKQGFFNIENDQKYDGKKVEFIKDCSGDIFGGWQKEIGKLKWSPVDKSLMAMKSKHRRRGWWIDKDIYVKFI